MRNVRIKSFQDNQGRVYELNEDSGFYINGTTTKGIMDFLTDGTYTIKSVKRLPSRDAHNGRTEVFSIGDNIQDNSSINKIVINQNKVKLISGDGTLLQSTAIESAIKYITPVQTQTTRTNTSNSFSDIEAAIRISHPRAIRLEKTLKKRKESIEDFLIKFFKEWNNEKRTIYCDDEETQTEVGKRRSLGDIYMICKYYYPNCTLKEIIKLLYITLPNHEEFEQGYRTCRCNTIHKRVWYYAEDRESELLNPTANDEYGHTHVWYREQFN